MSLLATARRDVTAKFVGELLSRTLFLLFTFYLGRRLGSVEFGTFNLAITTAYMVGVLFLDSGMNLPAVQLLVSDKDQRVVTASTVLTAKLILYFPMCLVLWVISRFVGSSTPAFSVLLLASIYILAFNLFEYFCAVTNAFHRMDIEAGLRIVNRLAGVGLGLVAVHFGGATAVMWALSAATLATSGIALLTLRRRLVKVRLLLDWGLLRRIAKMALPIAGTIVVGTIYMKWDLLVLSYFGIGRLQIGWYAGAFEIVEAFSALPSLLGAALFPLMVQLRDSNPDAMNRLLNASTKAVLLFAVPVAASVSLLSRQIIGLVYGAAYLPGANVLAVLIWCIVPIFLYFYLTYVNVASGNARHNLMGGTAALLGGLIANAILIPRIGYIGAAWAAIVANLSYALLATWRVCVLFRSARIPKVLLQLGIAGAAMVLTGLYTPLPIALQFLASVVVFLAVLLAARALNSEDLTLVLRILQMRAQPKAQEL